MDAGQVEPCDRTLALRAILAGVRAELIDLGACADDLQATIGAIVANAPAALGSGEKVRLQAADALSQRLERLARLADALQASVPDDWTLDPVSGVEVTHAVSRLVSAHPIIRDAALEEGDCELF